ncbi:MAG: hypothetical protein OFPII_43890 [Osedax symbiont Rs1]|nr:MAG: hypothetical protein OFPII_43890 [Osedax symbiont Rs1]
MTYYTLGTASKATGKTKTTISNAIKKGRISAVKNDLGHYQIDVSELHRVFPPIKKHRSRSTPKVTTQDHLIIPKNNDLNAQVYAKNEIIKMKDEMYQKAEREIEDLKMQRDQWQKEATANRLLLENHTNKNALKWYQRIFS